MGRRWLWILVSVAVLCWTPLLLGMRPTPSIGCWRGGADNPGLLLGFVAGGQALAAPVAVPTPPPPPGPLSIIIDAGTRRMYLLSGNTVYMSWPVAVGTPSTPTPIGHWAIKTKAIWGGAFGSRWMQLSIPWGTYGIHGTNQPGSIGTRASHGCVRMLNRDVIQLYDLVQVGTPVTVRGKPVQRFGEVKRLILPTLCGSDVISMQERLSELGYYSAPVTGYFGAQTVTAVKAFQTAQGLPPTGTVDMKTYDALGIVPLSEDPTLVPGTPVPYEPPSLTESATSTT